MYSEHFMLASGTRREGAVAPDRVARLVQHESSPLSDSQSKQAECEISALKVCLARSSDIYRTEEREHAQNRGIVQPHRGEMHRLDIVDNLSSSYENHYSPTNVTWSILDAILFGTWSNQSMTDTERTAPDGRLQKGPVRRLGVLRTYRGVYVKPGTSRRGEDCAIYLQQRHITPPTSGEESSGQMGKWRPTVIMGIAFSGVQTRREQDGSSDLEKRRPDDVALKAWCRSTGYSLVGLSERVDVCIPRRSDLGPR
ncbi:hypothetical protein EV421DRAFT_1949560 [Armillaria borealis]|uniref:Uncharacterized protein n=1 Tax=Armillaria borealis TaxID=47425 RepID=A0AA39MQS3_9AGAR|nr:hypothetical protein EV421DRAFT_1949560 [Armillaria borealis]